MNLGELLAIFTLVLTVSSSIDCVKTYMNPVYEPSNNEKFGHAGNPMKSNKNAQLHYQGLQAKFHKEKLKKQQAQFVPFPQAKLALDSYMKSYQEQHEPYQKEEELSQLNLQNNQKFNAPLLDFGKRLGYPAVENYDPRTKQTKNKQISVTPNGEPKIESRAFSLSESSYDKSPFIPMVPQYRSYTYEPQIKTLYAVKAYYPKMVQVGNDYYDNLKSLIGKEPEDQLKGLNQLLRTSKQYNFKNVDLSNAHINLKASTLDVPLSYGNPTKYPVFHEVKDYTPITEDVKEVAKVVLIPTTYHHQTTENPPTLTSSSNYYKVEVGQKTLAGIPESHSYVESSSKHVPLHDHYQNSYASKYEFGYRVKDFHSGSDFGHQETSLGDSSLGSYHVLLPDGRLQKVVYSAGPDGFKAHVSYT